MQATARYYSETQMQFGLVETILVREMKLEDRRKYVAGRLYRDFLTGINISASERLGQEEAMGSRAACHAASLNDKQSLS